MPNEQKQRIEAERLLHGLSKLEVPVGLEQRLIGRLRNAQDGGAHRTRLRALHKLTLVMTPIGLLILVVVGIWREKSRMLPPQARSAVGRNLSDAPGSSSTAPDLSLAIKAIQGLSKPALGKPSKSRSLARPKVSGEFKLHQDDFSAQKGDSPIGPNSGSQLENASGQTANAETIGTAIQGTQDFAVPGSPLPSMRAAGIPGEPLPLFELAAAPGTPLRSFTETTKNGD